MICVLSLWLLGISVTDLSRVIFASISIYFIFELAYKRRLSVCTKDFKRWEIWFLVLFSALYCLLIPVHQILKVYSSGHGIDFAIFTQVIDSIWTRHGFYSSLISDQWENFLGHHFAPFLAFPALLQALSIPSYVGAPVVHGAGLFLSCLGIFLFSRELNLSKSISVFLVVLGLANPSIRHTVFWGIHDETFALAFIPFVFLFWIRGQHWKSVLAMLLCCTTKESMFLMVACFSLMTVIFSLVEGEKRYCSAVPYGLVIKL